MRHTSFAALLLVLLVITPAIAAETLLVEARPDFASYNWITVGSNRYFFADVENIAHNGDLRQVIPASEANGNEFYYTSARVDGSLTPPDNYDYVDFIINIPTTGTYYIHTRVIKHGNDSPKARIYIDSNYKTSFNQSGQTSWHTFSHNFSTAGNHTVRYQVDYTGTPVFPYGLVGLDVIAVTNDSSYDPDTDSEPLMQNPYDTNDNNWLPRPYDDIGTISVSLNGKTANYTSTGGDMWRPNALLLIDHDSGTAQATINVSHSGDTFTSGDPSFTGASVTPSSEVATKVYGSSTYNSRDHHEITPNNDMVNDEVTLTSAPSGYTMNVYRPGFGTGDSAVRTNLAVDEYAWDGLGNTGGILPDRGYLMRLDTSPVRLAVVHTDSQADPLAWVTVNAVSPNNDDVHDGVTFYTNQSGTSVGVYDESNSLQRTLSGSGAWYWDGTIGGSVVPGNYTIQRRNSGTLVTGCHVEVLDKPAITDAAWDGEEFPIGVWAAPEVEEMIEPVFSDYVNHSCNTATWLAQSFGRQLDTAHEHGLKVVGDLSAFIYDNVIDQDQKPSEPELYEMFDNILGAYYNGIQVKQHPALAAYYIADEPGTDRIDDLRLAQQVLREVDPDHPSFMALVGNKVGDYLNADVKPPVLCMDVYPIGENASDYGDFRYTFNAWGNFLNYIDSSSRMNHPDILSRNVPTWLILQAHQFDGQLREPNPYEIRCQTYLALTRGVKGIFFFYYQTQQSWNGLVDTNYQETDRWAMLGDTYATIKPVLPILRDFEPASNIVSFSGGDNSWHSGEIKTLTDGSDTYFVAVRRECRPGYADPANCTISLNSGSPDNYYLKDITTFAPSIEVFQFNNAGTSYRAKNIPFGLGEGRIFKRIPADEQAPSTPQQLRITGRWAKKVALDWQDASDNQGIYHYRIYRNGSFVGTTTDSEYQDKGLTPGTEYSWQVKAYDEADNDSSVSNEATVATRTWNWQDANINYTPSPDHPAVFDAAGEVATVTGQGDFTRYYYDDICHFTWREMAGDGEVIARVTGFEEFADGSEPHGNCKAGVMIRSSLDNDAAHATTVIKKGGDANFYFRTADAGPNDRRDDITVPEPPYWVRLTRDGNLFSAYVSPDGENWTQLGYDGSQIITMPSTAYVGLVVMDYEQYPTHTPEPAQAVFDNILITNEVDMNNDSGVDYLDLREFAGWWLDPTPLDGDFNSDSDVNLIDFKRMVDVWNGGGYSAPDDFQAPSTPQALQVTGQTESTVSLGWSASTDNVDVAGYRVYRDGASVGTTSGAIVTYTDTGLTVNLAYSYRVSAFDAVPNESGQSNQVVGTPVDTVAPSVPSGLSVSDSDLSSISFIWTDSTDNVLTTGYRVFRDGGSIGTTSASAYTDTGLSGNTEYTYTVTAFDAVPNESAQSNPLLATTTTMATNYLLNPSFELDADSNGYPDNWSPWYGSGDATRVSASPYHGSYCCQVVNPGEEGDAYVQQTGLSLTAGNSYKLSGWMKTSSGISGGIFFRYVGSSVVGTWGNKVNSTDWVNRETASFDGSGSVRVDLNYGDLGATDTGWFDNMVLTEN